MLVWIEKIPIDLMGHHVLGYLDIRDIVMLERASSSQQSRNVFMNLVSRCPPVDIYSFKLPTTDHILRWFSEKNM